MIYYYFLPSHLFSFLFVFVHVFLLGHMLYKHICYAALNFINLGGITLHLQNISKNSTESSYKPFIQLPLVNIFCNYGLFFKIKK